MPYTSVLALERLLVHTSVFLHTCERFPLPALSPLLTQCSATGIIMPSGDELRHIKVEIVLWKAPLGEINYFIN